ncbi:MAG: EAL domain-containing protein [Pseudomonadota bacterium]
MKASLGKSPDLDDESTSVEAAVREIYRPILRGYFIVYASYYSVMLLLNWLGMPAGSEFLRLQTLTFIAVCLAMGSALRMRNPAPGKMIEALLLAMNATVIANIYVALSIGFVPEKLTYFIIASMLFALASTSIWQSVCSIVLAFVAMSAFAPRLDSGSLAAYGYLTFGAAMSSIAIAYYLRKAIARIAEANLNARQKLTSAQELSDQLREDSLSDSLTGLPNRRAFFARFNQYSPTTDDPSKMDRGNQNPSWLILLDLDGFKAVNDIHGHLIGDQLLIAVSERLRSFSPEDIHVSRMGGDEFNLIVSGNLTQQNVLERSKALLAEIAKPYLVDDRQVLISCSAGCVRVDSGNHAEPQISKADYALMEAKKQGKNRVVVFDEAHAKQAGVRFRIENALRGADLESEISVMFQPQFRLGTHEIVGAEVLARWTNPEVGPIPPQRFIQIAEESGLVAKVTLVVVKKALEEMSASEMQIPISINLSGHDLLSGPVIEEIIQLVGDYNIDPSTVEFEVTETAMMADIEKAALNLNRLSTLGFSIALDDFGTGYSNFNYLRSLPIKRLKVDKSFVENPGDPMAEKVLASLVGMARVLGVNCLLEGVEDEISLVMAKRAGAELVQGYLFAKPMNADELMLLLSDKTRFAEQSKAS